MSQPLPELVPIDSNSLPKFIDGIPYWHQRDERWCFEPYTITDNPDQTIGRAGCVVTTEAMLGAYFEDDLAITPPVMAKWNLAHNFRTENFGTNSALSIPAFTAEFGLGLEAVELDPERFRRALGGNSLIYTIVRHPDRENTLGTPGSHAIIIREINGDKLAAHSSSSDEKSLRNDWDLEQVISMADPAKTFRISR